ncbi:MAG: rRNA pseudouridine synthase [Cyclobacteriaceae bacterium]|nr:rRNA pseudouridine synthase [Cyclobacteriaceae bacterium]MDH4295777.1 rRNA pseudouridine synthase [Cyclobacteriaceae bacterium]MDH5247419.1 rRNA pseudouridine synthase [Cyclobacteriaceae bacterium]
MRKHNPSTPKGDRRGSSSRSSSAGKHIDSKSDYRPFKKSTKDERPFHKKQDSSSKRKDERSGSSETGKFFDKARRREKDAGAPAYQGGSRMDSRKKKDISEEAGGKRPYKKFATRRSGTTAVSREEKPHRGKESGSISGGFSKHKPYKKFDSNDKGRYGDKRAAPPSDSKSDKPYKKFEDKQVRKPYKREDVKYTRSNPALHELKGNPKKKEISPEAGKIRLNKFISNSGVCSRREADELIKMGLISVNGKTITELGYKVNPGDEVRHESKVLHAEKPVYILLNKPKGFLTTTADPQERNTVMHLIANVVKERVYPVGRLDRNTTGLLLLTNDGDLAEKLMHPSYNVKKIYKVELDRPLTKADAQRVLEGVKLEEGRATVDDLAIISDDRKTIGLEIHIGWNRVVRRIFESLEYKVVKLDRSVYAGLNKKDISRGEWRFLKKEELVLLKHFK